MQKSVSIGAWKRGQERGVCKRPIGRTGAAVAAFYLLILVLMLAGCGGGGGGGVSSQVVSGVAAVGAPLSGQVSIKDASTTTQSRTTVIGSDGSYALDVTGLKAPYILKATGSAKGVNHRLYSFASGPGRANINPLSSAAVANAAEVDDPEQVFNSPDHDKLDRIKSRLSKAIADLLNKLKPLLVKYAADSDDPITTYYKTDHTRLDAFFDAVKITLADGILTIYNVENGAVIFTAKVTDIIGGQLTDDDDDLPNPGSAPTAPTGLTATGGAGQVTLSWTAVGNATSYNMYWSIAPGVTKTNGAKIAGVTSPYIQKGLTAATTYYYILTAANSAGESPASAEVSALVTAVTPPPTAPAAPTGVSATGGTKQATISWSPVTGATSYNIYWSKTSGVTKTNGTPITGVTSPTVQTGLADSTTYYYIVTAVNSVGEGAASVQVAATTLTPTPAPTVPAAPTGLTATKNSASQITVSWSAATGADSYNLYRSTTSGFAPTDGGVTKIAGVTSPYANTGLSAGTTYYYKVTAVNSVGESVASAQATATTDPPPPAVPNAPSSVTATGGIRQVSIAWSLSSGATSYNLYWSTSSTVTTAGTKITGAANPYLQTGLANNTAYYYIVTAVNSSGESIPSATATATTSALPATPTGVAAATDSTTQISISWSAVTGADSYNLYRSTTSGFAITAAGVTKITGVTSTYANTGLAAGTTYYYRVTAVNSVGESPASTQVTATTTAAPTVPAAPTGVSAATDSTTQITISWSAVTGAGSYNLYRSTTSGFAITAAGVTKITGVTSPYANSGLAAGTTYYYRVTAVNSVGESAASAQVTATTTSTPPPPPPTLCVSCHGTPPATGKHTFHFPSKTNTCATCHGTGYDPYGLATALPATHMNGVTNIASGNPPGWNATTRSCSNTCHGTKAW